MNEYLIKINEYFNFFITAFETNPQLAFINSIPFLIFIVTGFILILFFIILILGLIINGVSGAGGAAGEVIALSLIIFILLIPGSITLRASYPEMKNIEFKLKDSQKIHQRLIIENISMYNGAEKYEYSLFGVFETRKILKKIVNDMPKGKDIRISDFNSMRHNHFINCLKSNHIDSINLNIAKISTMEKMIRDAQHTCIESTKFLLLDENNMKSMYFDIQK